MLGFGTPRSEFLKLPVPAFVIRHPSVGAFLIDSGFHASVSTSPAENLGRIATRFASPKVEPGKDLPSQLRDRGLDPKRSPLIVMTHLHFDHTSGMAEFPGATFVISETEWEAAIGDSRPILRGYRPQHYDYAFDYRTLSYDIDSISSYASFGRTFDLFGDGSVRLASTPGHTAGHQSVICRLADRDLVIAGDAIYTIGQLERRTRAAAPCRPPQLAALDARAAAVRAHLPAGHDPAGSRPRALGRPRRALRVATAHRGALFGLFRRGALGPVARALDCLAPAPEQMLALSGGHRRLVARRLAPHLRDLLGGPDLGPDSRQIGSTQTPSSR